MQRLDKVHLLLEEFGDDFRHGPVVEVAMDDHQVRTIVRDDGRRPDTVRIDERDLAECRSFFCDVTNTTWCKDGLLLPITIGY